jgi:hypothetical protein
MGWPTEQTIPIWRKLAGTFKDTPHVLFGLCTEPQSNDDGALDAQVWTAMTLMPRV